jgi:protease IV
MKSFFTSFFATLGALFVFCLGAVFVCFIMIAVLASMGEKPIQVPEGSYLVVDLRANIKDTPDQNEGLEALSELFGGAAVSRLQLRQVTRAIEAAAQDDAIKGILLTGQMAPEGYGSGFAALREVRAALLQFRASGKPIKAYLTFAGAREYYLASTASELTLDPYGLVFMPGLAAQPMFFAKAFEKFGVGVQVTRVGKYKAAVEPYTRTDMSAENRAQTQKLLDDVWADLVGAIEKERDLPRGAFQAIVDESGLIRADAAVEAKLADRVAYWDVVLEELKADTNRAGGRETFKQVALKNYAKLIPGDGLSAQRQKVAKVTPGGREKIGIVYAEGMIVDGDGKDENLVYGEKVARQIREVKAVVLRVNSPGGSASASEAIQREVRLTREIKPVIISMGTLAASGGYWIATYGNRIFAEPSTITGSIGVFGMFLNVQGLTNDKLGLTFDTVKTGRFADALTVVRPKSEAELALFQGFVDWIYDEFTGKVAESRNLDVAVVREIAQGRVWSGSEALKLGLVDELGGLSDAIRHAAQVANLGDNFRVVELPRRKQFAEALSEALEGKRREQAISGPAGMLLQQAREEWATLTHFNDPRGVYARLPFDLKLN